MVTRRFLNYFIDMFVISVIAILAIVIKGYFTQYFNPIAEEWLIYLIVIFLYYFSLEYFFSATLGKLATSTRVVLSDGNANRGIQILIRTLCRFIPIEPLSIFRQNQFMWHDELSKTSIVIKAKKTKGS